MLEVLSLCFALHLIDSCTCMDPKIVGGEYPNITQFPFVASLEMKCVFEDGVSYFACGSSILNQDVLLTAAHCMHSCMADSYITASVGHCNNKKGHRHWAYSYFAHNDYHPGVTDNDIALVRLRTSIEFTKTVGRVAIMKQPPYKEKAQVAGWGLISELERICGDQLKFVDQYVWEKEACLENLVDMPEGTICASSQSEDDYASIGDSGGPLVVHGYLQIGIVSYKKPSVSRSIIVYTDTGYFYDWIQDNAQFILCDSEDDDDDYSDDDER